MKPISVPSAVRLNGKQSVGLCGRRFYIGEWACKPGSVNGQPSIYAACCQTALATSMGRPGQPVCPSTVLLRIEFTSENCLQPPDGLLPPSFHPYCAKSTAVSLCCTCPEVAFGGRYPLSLPCGARTFLTHDLSVCARGCLTYSRSILYRVWQGRVKTEKPEASEIAFRCLCV